MDASVCNLVGKIDLSVETEFAAMFPVSVFVYPGCCGRTRIPRRGLQPHGSPALSVCVGVLQPSASIPERPAHPEECDHMTAPLFYHLTLPNVGQRCHVNKLKCSFEMPRV